MSITHPHAIPRAMSVAHFRILGRREVWFAEPTRFFRSGSAAFMEGPKKDTRPIKDKHWQAEKSSELIEFLIAANYNHHISPKILQNPTRKDFECIFQVCQHLPQRVYEERCGSPVHYSRILIAHSTGSSSTN